MGWENPEYLPEDFGFGAGYTPNNSPTQRTDGLGDTNQQYRGPETSGSATTVPYGTRTDDNESLIDAILDTIAEWERKVTDLRAEANLIEAHARLLADILYPEEIGGNQ